MARTLIFDKDFKVKEAKKDVFKFKADYLYWTHLTKDDDIIKEIIKQLGKGAGFHEDLIENQRPNLVIFKKYSVVVFSVPNKKSLRTGELLQVSCILSKHKLITITNKKSDYIDKLFNKFLEKKIKVRGMTSIFSSILDGLIENSINTLEDVEKYLMRKEREIIDNKGDEKLLVKAHRLKENIYFINKNIEGDIEVVREILMGRAKSINLEYFSEHLEDRLLYLHDYSDLLRETINSNVDMYLSMLSHQLNKQIFKLTIIGSLLIIPSIISGFFGMNVKLPPLGFWEIFIISLLLSGITYYFIKK